MMSTNSLLLLPFAATNARLAADRSYRCSWRSWVTSAVALARITAGRRIAK